MEAFPHHAAVGRIIPIFSSASLARPLPANGAASAVGPSGENGAAGAAAAAAAAGEAAVAPAREPGDVIGCYEMRHGQGESNGQDPDAMPITPAEFATYMMYVTQWRWLQPVLTRTSRGLRTVRHAVALAPACVDTYVPGPPYCT